MDKFGNHINKKLNLQLFYDNFSNILLRNKTGEFDLQHSRITGVKTPLRDTDAVNKEYVDRKCESYLNNQNEILIDTLKLDIEKHIQNFKELFYTKVELDKIVKSFSVK